MPSSAAFSQLEFAEDDQVYLAQCDVQCAFYRVALPPGMDDFFVLPAVRVKELRAAGASVPSGLADFDLLSVALHLLPMVFLVAFLLPEAHGEGGCRCWH